MTKLETVRREVGEARDERKALLRLIKKNEQQAMVAKAMCMVMASALIVTNAAWLVIWAMG